MNILGFLTRTYQYDPIQADLLAQASGCCNDTNRIRVPTSDRRPPAPALAHRAVSANAPSSTTKEVLVPRFGFLTLRVQTTLIAVNIYVNVLFTAVNAAVRLAVGTSLALARFQLGDAQATARTELGILVHAVKQAIVLPFIMVAGFFAPTAVYGAVAKAYGRNPITLANEQTIQTLTAELSRTTLILRDAQNRVRETAIRDQQLEATLGETATRAQQLEATLGETATRAQQLEATLRGNTSELQQAKADLDKANAILATLKSLCLLPNTHLAEGRIPVPNEALLGRAANWDAVRVDDNSGGYIATVPFQDSRDRDLSERKHLYRDSAVLCPLQTGLAGVPKDMSPGPNSLETLVVVCKGADGTIEVLINQDRLPIIQVMGDGSAATEKSCHLLKGTTKCRSLYENNDITSPETILDFSQNTDHSWYFDRRTQLAFVSTKSLYVLQKDCKWVKINDPALKKLSAHQKGLLSNHHSTMIQEL